jgi:hypothetical protein
VLKKAQFLVIMVAAALVLLAALSLSFRDGSVQSDTSIVGNAGRVTKDTPLPNLSESVGQSQPNPAPSQTDNSTAPTSSSGVVKASFTVVSQPVSDQGESGSSSAGSVARGSNDASPAIPAQAVSSAAANDQLGTAADLHPKSGGLTIGWVLLVAVWSLEIALMCGLAFLHVRARKRVLGHTTTSSSEL